MRVTKIPVVVVLFLFLTVTLAGCSNQTIDQDGRWEESIAKYDGAVPLNPLDADFYYNRGIAYAELGEYQRVKDRQQFQARQWLAVCGPCWLFPTSDLVRGTQR